MIFICKDCGTMVMCVEKPNFCYIDRSPNIMEINLSQARDMGVHDYWPAVGLIPRSLSIDETRLLNQLVETSKSIMPEFPGDLAYDCFTGEKVKRMHGHICLDKVSRINKMKTILGV